MSIDEVKTEYRHGGLPPTTLLLWYVTPKLRDYTTNQLSQKHLHILYSFTDFYVSRFPELRRKIIATKIQSKVNV